MGKKHKREKGYYWCKFEGEWQVFKYDPSDPKNPWTGMDSLPTFRSNMFKGINETKIDQPDGLSNR